VLPLRADQELPEHLRDQRLQDRGQQVITTCGGGGQAALGAKLLKDMGFDTVAMIDGGTTGWKNAGLPVQS
jgi:rhodanese-related sulfurtransferase